MVSDPADYRWTSYRWHGLGERNELITDHPLYLGLARDDDERRAAYRALFRAHLDEAVRDHIRKTLNKGHRWAMSDLGNRLNWRRASALRRRSGDGGALRKQCR